MNIKWSTKYDFPSPNNSGSNDEWPLKELAERLIRLNAAVNVNALGVPDVFYEGGWCIHKEGNVWLVYHSRRGRRRHPVIFANCSDASNYYIWLHTGSHTI